MRTKSASVPFLRRRSPGSLRSTVRPTLSSMLKYGMLNVKILTAFMHEHPIQARSKDAATHAVYHSWKYAECLVGVQDYCSRHRSGYERCIAKYTCGECLCSGNQVSHGHCVQGLTLAARR